MTTKERVLASLEQHRGQAISGQSLANQLGISRTAVWKAIQALIVQGHAIESTPNQGYTLQINNDILSPQGIRRYLKGDLPLEVYQQIGSTNARAKELAVLGAPHGALFVANSQTEGRGRRGRSFVSPADTGLYLSMIVRSKLPMEKNVLITSAAAVAVCRAVEQTTGKHLSIKWVNDLYTNQGKCCGILTEAATDLETGDLDYIVVGVGLNLLPPKNGWPPDVQGIAASVFEKSEPIDRCRLTASIANHILAVCEELPTKSFMEEYRSRNIVPGRQVTIVQNGISRSAFACSITDEGHLIVRLPDGNTQELSFGEVSIRL